MAEAENFLDKSTSCNASDMVPCDVVAPPEVNLLTKASRVFTLTITYFDFLFCRIHPSWKIPSHDISICSMRTFLTHGIILNSPWNTETVLSSKATALSNRLLALHRSFYTLAVTTSVLLFTSHFLPLASPMLFLQNQISWSFMISSLNEYYF